MADESALKSIIGRIEILVHEGANTGTVLIYGGLQTISRPIKIKFKGNGQIDCTLLSGCIKAMSHLNSIFTME